MAFCSNLQGILLPGLSPQLLFNAKSALTYDRASGLTPMEGEPTVGRLAASYLLRPTGAVDDFLSNSAVEPPERHIS